MTGEEEEEVLVAEGERCLAVEMCPCGGTDFVWVSSHFQCARCGRVVSSCCEGENW